MRAALGSRHGMDFVHDDGFDSREYPARLGSEQQEQRFGCGDEDVWWMADDSASLLWRGIPAAHGHADIRSREAHRLALFGDAVQWSLQVFRDIRAQRLQWRDVQHFDAAGRLAAFGV